MTGLHFLPLLLSSVLCTAATGASAILFGAPQSRPALSAESNQSVGWETPELEFVAPYEALPELVSARVRQRKEEVVRGTLRPLQGRRLGGVLLPHRPQLATCEEGKGKLVPGAHLMNKVRILSARGLSVQHLGQGSRIQAVQ